MVKKKITLTYFIEDRFDEHDFECTRKGIQLNLTIYNALQSIRSRLKYAEDVSDAEIAFLEQLRAELGAAHIEEQ